MSKNDDRNDCVVALVRSGHSYTEAAELCDITRNAVAGIMYRYHEARKRRDPHRNRATKLFGPPVRPTAA